MKYIKQIFLQLIKIVLKRKNVLVMEEGKVVDGEKVAVEINLLPEVKVKAPILTIPISWTLIWENLSNPVSKIVKSLNKPTANVPQIPAAKWTGTAPTTSSISNLFKISLTIIAMIAPMMPTKIDITDVIELHPAVIATNPAKGPKII